RAFFLSFAMARSLLGGFLLARITSTTRAVTGPTRAEVALRAITGPTTAASALTRVSSQSLNSAPWLVAEKMRRTARLRRMGFRIRRLPGKCAEGLPTPGKCNRGGTLVKEPRGPRPGSNREAEEDSTEGNTPNRSRRLPLLGPASICPR